jgi:hypothetical protein
MRLMLLPLALLACTPAAERRPADPSVLRGVTIGLPAPADARDTPGIGCGQVMQDLPLRAHKALIASFSDAGANATNSSTGPWVLTVALREATMGPENERPRPTDRPLSGGVPQPDQPPPEQPQQSWLNSGQGTVSVVLDATLSRDGNVVWRDTVSGHARSAPCVQAVDKVREALQDAVDALRAKVIPLIRIS